MDYKVKRTDDELYHYGVKGMKWGIRRGKASQTYAKGVQKLKKLEKKEDKYRQKSDKRASSKLSTGPMLTDIHKWSREKALQYDVKSKGYAIRGKKLYNEMKNVFKDVPIDSLKSSDVDYMRNYKK